MPTYTSRIDFARWPRLASTHRVAVGSAAIGIATINLRGVRLIAADRIAVLGALGSV
jgi:hypothetical protein